MTPLVLAQINKGVIPRGRPKIPEELRLFSMYDVQTSPPEYTRLSELVRE